MLDKVSPPPPGTSNDDEAARHEHDAGRRKLLFERYMDTLCGSELKLQKKDFLARGEDPGGKGDFQGCSEFNPVLIFSSKDQSTFEQSEDKTARNDANATNRRVMVLIFRKGSRVDPLKWPCPRATDGVAACKKRFFADGEQRRTERLLDKPRTFAETRDTFACRFYHRLTNSSPCEVPREIDRVTIVFDDPMLGFAGQVEINLRFSNGSQRQVQTNDVGEITVDARVGDFVDIEYKRNAMKQVRRVFLRPIDVSANQGAWQRLSNLGYVYEATAPETPQEFELFVAVQRFQCDFGVLPDGELTDSVRAAIRDAHDQDVTEWKKRIWAREPSPGPDDPDVKSDIS